MKRLFIEIITLRTARGRVLLFGTLTALIFFSRYHWLDHLSIWGDLGISHAPSIGLTRAYWLFIHGHPFRAWHRNPLIYIVLLIGLPLIAKDSLTTWRWGTKIHKTVPSP